MWKCVSGPACLQFDEAPGRNADREVVQGLQIGLLLMSSHSDVLRRQRRA